MPGKTNKTILLGMLLPGQERWPRREPPLWLLRTSRVRYLPPQLGLIRGMSVIICPPVCGRYGPIRGRNLQTGLEKLLAFAVIAAALSLSSTVVLAADSCVWSRQPDGSDWGTCVNDKGTTYCQSCPANGGACSVVSCSK